MIQGRVVDGEDASLFLDVSRSLHVLEPKRVNARRGCRDHSAPMPHGTHCGSKKWSSELPSEWDPGR